MIFISFISIILSSIISYFINILLVILVSDREKLIKEVEKDTTELIILQLWKEVINSNKTRILIGYILMISLLIVFFYFILTFSNIWYNWRLSLLISLILSLLVDFFLFEIIIEGIIALIYYNLDNRNLYTEK